MDSYVTIEKEEIYDILCGCGLMTIYTKEYGSLEMTDEDSIMEDFIPAVVDYINDELDNTRLFLE